MKKAIFFVLLLFGFISFADNSISLKDLSFQNLGMPNTSVKKALKLGDRSSISLKGKITQYLENDKFQFEDSTASIVIIIKDNVLPRSQVSLNKLVKINGDVLLLKDKWHKKRVISVNEIEFLDEVSENKAFDNNKYDFPNLTTIRKAKRQNVSGDIIDLYGKFIDHKEGSEGYVFKDKTGKIFIVISSDEELIPLNKYFRIRILIDRDKKFVGHLKVIYR